VFGGKLLYTTLLRRNMTWHDNTRHNTAVVCTPRTAYYEQYVTGCTNTHKTGHQQRTTQGLYRVELKLSFLMAKHNFSSVPLSG
jgi:hypothetical protein